MKKIILFEGKHREKLILIFRLLVAFLFIFSAIAKLMPILVFEHQLVLIASKPGILHGFTNWCNVGVWARLIIIFELFLGISFLIPYHLKRITIPLAISLLVGFIFYLGYQISAFGNSGNCGCMGGLVPMSPLEAIIKNIVTICILGYLWKYVKIKETEYSVVNLMNLGATALVVFLFFPIKNNCCCGDEIALQIKNNNEPLYKRIDSLASLIANLKDHKIPGGLDTVTKPKPIPQFISEFNTFHEFELNGNRKYIDIDKGKSIVCVMNPDCDHCLEITKQLKKLNLKKDIQWVFLFHNLDETDLAIQKTQVNSFCKKAGVQAIFKIVSDMEFIRLIGNAPNPPRVCILNNGKILYDYLGGGELNTGKILKL
jgi:hypothetical protein